MDAVTTTSNVLDATALTSQLGLADTIVDPDALANSVRKCADNNVVLPTFAQLANPSLIPADVAKGVDKNSPDSRNLFRVHWFNDLAGNRVSVPDHVVLPSSLTGVASPIIVVFGDR
ncbi:MAG: pyridoxal-5'-phosphate-dependent protein subunit beta, partial [Ilumatobacteraceae bacterium]